MPIVADARSEQHGDALVDERLTNALFKGAAIPLRLSVVVGRIAAQCAHPRTACTAVTQTFMAHDAKHLFVAANVAGDSPNREGHELDRKSVERHCQRSAKLTI